VAGNVCLFSLVSSSCDILLTVLFRRYGEDTALTEGYVKDLWDDSW